MLRGHPQSGEGEVWPMRTGGGFFFGTKNFGFFIIYGVSTRTRGVEPVRIFFGQEVNFSRFCADDFYERPHSICSIFHRKQARLLINVMFVTCLFVPSLSSCHEKAMVTLYFGRIGTRLGVVYFRVFRLFLWLLTTEFAACSKP